MIMNLEMLLGLSVGNLTRFPGDLCINRIADSFQVLLFLSLLVFVCVNA